MLIVLQVGCRDRAFGASLGAPVRSSARPGPGPGPPPKSVGCEGGGDAQGGAPAAGSPPGGWRGFPGEPKLDGRSHGWDDSRGGCLLWAEEKTTSVSVRKLYWLLLFGVRVARSPGRGYRG